MYANKLEIKEIWKPIKMVLKCCLRIKVNKAFVIPILTTITLAYDAVRIGIANAFIYFYSQTAHEHHLYWLPYIFDL